MSEQLLKERNQMSASQMVAMERERRVAEEMENGGKRRRESMDVRMKEEIEGGRKKGGEGEGEEVAEVAVVEQRKTSSTPAPHRRSREKQQTTKEIQMNNLVMSEDRRVGCRSGCAAKHDVDENSSARWLCMSRCVERTPDPRVVKLSQQLLQQ